MILILLYYLVFTTLMTIVLLSTFSVASAAASLYVSKATQKPTYPSDTVFIQIDAHALINLRSPPSSLSAWHTRMGEIDDFCIKMD